MARVCADVLHHAPDSARTGLDPRFGQMQYDDGTDADARFAAWCEGRTGFPFFVDAGMAASCRRGLDAQPGPHGDGGVVPREGPAPLPRSAARAAFMPHLRDGDLASNQHGWQWGNPGSGTDAAPYFRQSSTP